MLTIQESFARDDGPRLYVCSTPIGNLEDVSQRLLAVLREADVVAAEDTRHTRKLLARYDIHPPRLVSCHEHNETDRLRDLESWFAQGWRVALVSDAGTPLVSDPGARLVTHALALGVPVIPVPGPSAVLAALVAAGLPGQPFTFAGFLPRARRDRQALFSQWRTWPGTIVCYEAPHRLRDALADLAEVLPTARVTLAKELTKRHETFVRGTALEVAEWAREADVRGEFVLVVDPGPARSQPQAAGGDAAEAALGHAQAGRAHEAGSITLGHVDEREDAWAAAVAEVRRRVGAGEAHAAAVREVAREYGMPRRALYQATLGAGE